jgi:hypothetical protein
VINALRSAYIRSHRPNPLHPSRRRSRARRWSLPLGPCKTEPVRAIKLTWP